MRSEFGRLPDGRPVEAIRIEADGIRATVLTLGASLADLQIETPAGWHRVVLGFPDLGSYLAHRTFMGAIVGRCANRIAGGFVLDGVPAASTCTAARTASTAGCGPWRASTPTGCRCRSSRPTATKAIRAPSTPAPTIGSTGAASASTLRPPPTGRP